MYFGKNKFFLKRPKMYFGKNKLCFFTKKCQKCISEKINFKKKAKNVFRKK